VGSAALVLFLSITAMHRNRKRAASMNLGIEMPNVIYWTNKSQSKQRYQEHIKYIRHNEPQPAYAQHIHNVKNEYGTINNTMNLLEHINKLHFYYHTNNYVVSPVVA
jgi:hypothetical protein